MMLKEAILTLLQEAGEEGLTCEQMVEMIKEREMYHWHGKGTKDPMESVRVTCIKHPSIVGVAPYTYALRASQEDGVKPHQPMTLKEAILLHCTEALLQRAGQEGLTCERIFEMMKEREMDDWKDSEKLLASIQ